MARRRYLIAYDIADQKRLRRICTLMEDHGRRLQYSVFLCDLSTAELVELECSAVAIMNSRVDSIVRVDLGSNESPAAVRVIGARREFPGTGPQIV